MGRTGTTSLARMFGRFRAGHEIDGARMVPIATAALRAGAPPAGTDWAIRRRDFRYRLALDSASFLGPLVAHFVRVHPRARFVLTLRECRSWVGSALDFECTSRPGGPWPAYAEARFGRYGEVFGREEEPLVDAGARWPIAARLRAWTELSQFVLATVPEDRLLVVKTEELGNSVDRLAAFVGTTSDMLVPVHANRNEERPHLLDRVPSAFVDDLAHEHCDRLMTRFWGDDWLTTTARSR